jgi:uncharacterized protein
MMLKAPAEISCAPPPSTWGIPYMNDLNQAGYSSGELSADEKNMAMLGHLSSLSGFIVPFGNLIGPLLVWQLKKDTMPFAAEQAKEALNFNITVAIAGIVAAISMFILIGFVLAPIVVIAWVVLSIIAGINAGKGENYRYPFTLRLVS